METRRFLNSSQPQTLQIATLLLYINAVFALLQLNPLTFITVIGGAFGYGIANDKKWGYYGAIVTAAIALGFAALGIVANGLDTDFIVNVLFKLALVVLLFHPMSRDYTRLWFK